MKLTIKGYFVEVKKYDGFIKDLGLKFATEKSKSKSRFWQVKCRVCSEEYETNKKSAINSNFLCKPCSKRIQKTIHGDHANRLNRIFRAMKQRCYNSNNNKFCYYGGKGISICEQWKDDYLEFKKWAMENGYSDSLTIDRINPDGNYEPNNCRWASNEVQHRNTCKLMSTNTSGYRGILLHKQSNKWQAKIMVNKKNISLGYYSTKEEAAKAYDDYVSLHSLEHTQNKG